jgi:hypothetical protein
MHAEVTADASYGPVAKPVRSLSGARRLVFRQRVALGLFALAVATAPLVGAA